MGAGDAFLAVTAPLAGLLCDRFPPALVGSIGLGLSTLGLLLLVFLPEGFTVFDLPHSHRARLRTVNCLERINRVPRPPVD